ncbi:vWA domain-containing protein [Actinoplanes sp. HUAS TT8]|uniref:vWA domain-containing protein n=1 Tax=Actinoplanes sp. HUAS TT8 TaxID=3447453 RepID=UPI003F527D1E
MSTDDVGLRLAAGRAVAGEALPYLRTALFAMVPVVTTAVPACAVDRRWRMYVNPDHVLALTVDEVAGLWLHELGHVLHGHAERWRLLLEPETRQARFAVAADAAVNEVLTESSITLAPGRATIWSDIPGARPGLTAEQLYRLLPESPNGPNGDCGSGVSGGPRPWDRDDADDGEPDGTVDEGRAEMIRRQVAHEIRIRQRSIGDVPAGLLRLAEQILVPLVDWRRELNSVVSRARATVAGLRDYTFTRMSRRAASSPGVVLPAMRRPRPPRLDVVIDTSASVSATMLAQVKAELRVVITRLRGEYVRVLACDAAARESRRVRDVDDIELRGGGGTDLRVGLAASAALRPRADIVIVATDGDTPWDDRPPPDNPRARYVVLLLDGDREDIPPWMHAIVVPSSE